MSNLIFLKFIVFIIYFYFGILIMRLGYVRIFTQIGIFLLFLNEPRIRNML